MIPSPPPPLLTPTSGPRHQSSPSGSYHLGCALDGSVLRIHSTERGGYECLSHNPPPFIFSPGASVTITGGDLSVLAAHACCLRLGLSGAHVTSKPAAVSWQRLLFLLLASKVLLQLEEVKRAFQCCARCVLSPSEPSVGLRRMKMLGLSALTSLALRAQWYGAEESHCSHS